MGSNPYIFGGEMTAKGRRLLEQGRGLEPEADCLLDRISVEPGWRAVDAAGGPLGTLDLLAERVRPAGEVIGLKRDSRLIEMG